MDNYDTHNPVKINECAMKAANLYYVYVYLVNANQSKYGMLVENLKEQLSLGNNQYPHSVDKAYEVFMVKSLTRNWKVIEIEIKQLRWQC